MVKWDLFRTWLQGQHLDCICLQDTGWSFSGEWQDNHVGAIEHRGGLLWAVRRKCWNIAWTTPLDSRISHVRLYMGSVNIDILNVYQYPQHGAPSQPTEERTLFWTVLQRTLNGLPRRNCWVIGGDFNTSLRSQPGSVGLSDFAVEGSRSRGTHHSDQPVLQELLRTFSLTALNTWTRELGATYFGPRQVQTRIDFILVQQQDGDFMAKRVTYVPELPQQMGLSRDHVPLLGGIQRRRFYTPKNDSGLTKNQRATLLHHWESQTEEWTTLINTVASQLHHWSPDHPDLDALNEKMMQVCRHFSLTASHAQESWPLKPSHLRTGCGLQHSESWDSCGTGPAELNPLICQRRKKLEKTITTGFTKSKTFKLRSRATTVWFVGKRDG